MLQYLCRFSSNDAIAETLGNRIGSPILLLGKRITSPDPGGISVRKVCLCGLGILLLALFSSITSASDLFAPAVNYYGGDSPKSVCTADFDGDGHADLAIANYWDNYVAILLGSGDGSFMYSAEYGVGSGPQLVCAGDFDEDGCIDLAAANYHSDNVSILLNLGDGTFAPATHYGAKDGPISVCTGDFDEDGHIDLAVANNGYDYPY